MSKRRKLMVSAVMVGFALLMPQIGLCQADTAFTQSAGLSQQSGTTGGELKRYIDVSSPWSGGYLFVDMTIIGSASVTESFTMNNIGPGSEADYWKRIYDDFGIGFAVNPGIFPQTSTPASPAPVRSSTGKPAAVVAGVSVVAVPEGETDIRAGFRWLDLF